MTSDLMICRLIDSLIYGFGAGSLLRSVSLWPGARWTVCLLQDLQYIDMTL